MHEPITQEEGRAPKPLTQLQRIGVIVVGWFFYLALVSAFAYSPWGAPASPEDTPLGWLLAWLGI